MRTVTLDDVAVSIVDGPFGSSLKVSDYVETGVPVLQGKNITGDAFVWKDVRYISQKKAAELKRSSVVEGDHLLVKIGSIGYSAIVDDLDGNDFAIIPANLARLRPDRTKVDDRYLHQWLKSANAKAYFQSVASATAQPALSLAKIKAARLPLPPLDEQRRIAAILDQADALRRKRRGALELIDLYPAALFEQRFGAERGVPVEKLNAVCDLITDGTHYTPTYVDDGVIFLSAKNVTSGRVDWDNIKHIPNSLHKELQKRVSPRIGDVLLAKNGTTGVAAIVDRDLVFDIYVSLALLRSGPKLLPPFLCCALNAPSAKRQFNHSLKGIGVSNLHLVDIRNAVIPVPRRNEQADFVRELEATDRLRSEILKSVNAHDELFTSLQHRAFNGEL